MNSQAEKDESAQRLRTDVARCLSVLVSEINGLSRSRTNLRWDDHSVYNEVVREEQTPEGKTRLTLTKTLKIHPTGSPEMTVKADTPIIVGGGGIVFKCSPASLEQVENAFKITRPSLIEGPAGEDEYAATRNEFLNHAPLAHLNITRIFDGDVVKAPMKPTDSRSHIEPAMMPLPAMRMEWITGAETFSTYLINPNRILRHHEVINLLAQALDGLHALHKSGLIHCDVKSDNILVDNLGVVKVSDLGNAIAIPQRGDSPPTIQTSRWNLPKFLQPKRGRGVDSKRVQITFPTVAHASPWFDLAAFALELNRLFLADVDFLETEEDSSHYPPRDRVLRFLSTTFPNEDSNALFSLRCIRLLIRTLIHAGPPSVEDYYCTAESLADDLRKVLPEFGAAQNVEDLRSIPQNVIKLPTNGNISFTKSQRILIDSEPIARLRKHRQLATVDHAYPGAMHTRFEHTNGVAWNCIGFIRALYSDRDNPLWRILIEEFDVRALITAALFHDVGHIAFGHYLEELIGTFHYLTHEDYVIALLDQTRDHHFGELTTAQLKTDRAAAEAAISQAWSLDSEATAQLMHLAAEIIRPKQAYVAAVAEDRESLLARKGTRNRLKILLLHSVLDGPIDADKMDYLARDAHHSGVAYGAGFDRDRFFQSLTAFITKEPGSEPRCVGRVGISIKGLLPVESMLMSRYQMFSVVYWHKTTRSETAMLKAVLLNFLNGYDPAFRADALDKVISVFRMNEDASALALLRRRIESSPEPDSEETTTLEDSTRQRLGEMCTALLSRQKTGLYKNVFELRYNPKESAINQYQSLVDESTKALSTDRPFDDFAFYELAVESFTKKFRQVFEQTAGVQFPELGPLDVIVDIPPFGKDQATNFFIDYHGEPVPICDASTIAWAVSQSLRYWARVLRIYFHPSHHAHLKDFLQDNPKIRKSDLFYSPCEAMFLELHKRLGAQLSQGDSLPLFAGNGKVTKRA